MNDRSQYDRDICHKGQTNTLLLQTGFCSSRSHMLLLEDPLVFETCTLEESVSHHIHFKMQKQARKYSFVINSVSPHSPHRLQPLKPQTPTTKESASHHQHVEQASLEDPSTHSSDLGPAVNRQPGHRRGDS